MRAVWTEILSSCWALKSPLVIAYLGPPATFTHQAALARFGSIAEYRPVRTNVDVFEEVERGAAHHGVVPVENTTEGAVNVTLDRLTERRARPSAESWPWTLASTSSRRRRRSAR